MSILAVESKFTEPISSLFSLPAIAAGQSPLPHLRRQNRYCLGSGIKASSSSKSEWLVLDRSPPRFSATHIS